VCLTDGEDEGRAVSWRTLGQALLITLAVVAALAAAYWLVAHF
jgi:hypothetical protein